MAPTSPRSWARSRTVAALRAALELPEVGIADVFVVEIKAAAIDVVADAAEAAWQAHRLLRQPPAVARGRGRCSMPRCSVLADEAVDAHA